MSLIAEKSVAAADGLLAARPTLPRGYFVRKQAPLNPFIAHLHTDRASIEPLWRTFERDGATTAYQRLDWIDGICDHMLMPAKATAFFIEIRDVVTNAAIMLLPLALTRCFGVRIIGWLSLGVCDYAAPLMAAGLTLSNEQAVCVWSAVRAVLPKADMIDICQMPPDVHGVTNPLVVLPTAHRMDLEAFGLVIEGDREFFVLSVMGKKAYRDLMRRRRRLEERGTVDFVEAKTESEVLALFATMCGQRGRRFQKLGRFDFLSRLHVANFYRDVALRSLREGGPAHLFGIRVGEEWVATAYIIVHANVFHGIVLTMGSEEWKKFSPGLLLASELMEWSVREGHRYFDMTVSNLPYKEQLGAESRDLFRILEARTPLGLIAMKAHAGAANVKSHLHHHPRLFGVLRSTRQWARRRLTVPNVLKVSA